MRHDVVKKFIEAFVVVHQSHRYLSLISSKKGYKKFLGALSHKIELNSSMTSIPPDKQSLELIMSILPCTKNARAYVISENSEFDGTELTALEGLQLIYCSGFTSFLVIHDKDLICYCEGEGANKRLYGISKAPI